MIVLYLTIVINPFLIPLANYFAKRVLSNMNNKLCYNIPMSIKTHIISFKQGDIIFNAGDRADCAYIVESGTVSLRQSGLESELVATLEKGGLLGEMGVINNAARSISAFAETDVELLVIDTEQITTRLDNSDPIIRGVMEVLLTRIRKMLNDGKQSQSSNQKTNNVIVTEGMHKIRFEKELFSALENNEILNVYQPIIGLKNNDIAGFEALCRWNHPEKGMVSPFEFISLAEESDFIIKLGLTIFDDACKHLQKFQDLHSIKNPKLAPLFMSINVSAAQLTSHQFLAKIKAIVDNYKINPKHIKIEITESLVVDFKSVSTWIYDCHALGFNLSLDDFGTGYSGFQSLLELNFQTIKIDQVFVNSMETNPKSNIMLEIITDMAKRLNMSIVAEGIEEGDQAQKLAKIGVDYGQGYYFSKPVHVDEIVKRLK